MVPSTLSGDEFIFTDEWGTEWVPSSSATDIRQCSRSVKCLRGPTSIHENISKQNKVKTNNEAHGKGCLVRGTDRHHSRLGTHNSTEFHHHQARALQLAPHDWVCQMCSECPCQLPTVLRCPVKHRSLSGPPYSMFFFAPSTCPKIWKKKLQGMQNALFPWRLNKSFWTIWSWKKRKKERNNLCKSQVKYIWQESRIKEIHPKLRELCRQTSVARLGGYFLPVSRA